MIFPLLFACSEHDLKSLSDDIDTPIEDGDAINFEPTEEPNIYVDPPLADFGGVMKDCPSDWMNINIQNRGLEDLVISSMDLLGEDFALEAFDENTSEYFQNGTIVLPYAQSIDVQIRLTPDYFIDYDATLQIHSNDPDEGIMDVLATGKGTAGPQFEESFVQTFHEKVDLLWVIDNSPSMEDNIWHVQQNFQSFLGSFLSLGLDFQMAITTTDPDLRGRFQGSPEILTSDMVQSIISTTFIDTLTGLGTEGAFWEEGLQVTKYALENTMQKNLFLRGDDAALSVIIVSDEDDNGSALQGQQFIDWFQGL